METPFQRATRETEERFGCAHPNKVERYKSDSLRRKQYRLMCVRCGHLDTHIFSVKGRDQREVDMIPEYDPWNWEAWQRNRQEHRQSLVEKYTKEGRRDLDEYYRTPQWEAIRKRVLRRAGNRCEGCGVNDAAQVHHLTYERFGAEMLFDLVAVCVACHERIHPHMSEG